MSPISGAVFIPRNAGNCSTRSSADSALRIFAADLEYEVEDFFSDG
jgi:hypothetical protein